MNARTRSITAAAALAAALAVAAGACSGTSISQEVARDKKVDVDMAAVTAAGIPGVSIVIRDGGSTSRVALGVGEVATNTPMQVDDQVRIGSVAKTFVSVVVLQLVDEGKLGLDDPIEKWVPGLVPDAADITVRMLLNHTSGIANYEEHPDYMAPYMAGDVAHETTPAQLVAMGNALGPWFSPGADAAYSNTNYTVAGLVVEKVTSSTLGAQLDRRIFRKLDLESTSLPSAPELTGQHAHGYFVMGDPAGPATDVTTFSPSIGWAGGGIVSTPDDVTKFYRALLDGSLLSQEMLAEMMNADHQVGQEMYGLGLAAKQLPCGTVYGHGGNFPGYLMESYHSADARNQVTVSYNLDPNSMPAAAIEAVERLLVDAYCG